MARMFPKRWNLPTDGIAGRRAEYETFEAFRRLGQEFAVYYAVNLTLARPGEPRRDLEIDFVVTHPQLGVMIVEVKSGRVTVHDRAWYRRSRGGLDERLIPDPVTQLRNAKHGLADLIRADRRWSGPKPALGGAVVLPDVKHAWPFDMADLPGNVVATSADLANLEPWLLQAFAYCAAEGRLTTAPQLLDLVHRYCNTTISLEAELSGLGASLSETERQLEDLTQRQIAALDSLRRNNRVVVRGPAGSGKTILALRRGGELAAQRHKVLYTCFNECLSEYARSKAGSAGVICLSFHELGRRMAKRADVPFPPSEMAAWDKAAQQRWWRDGAAEALMKAIERFPNARFDAICVDEAQDFSDTWLTVLKLFLVHPDESFFWLFTDDHQRIYEGGGGDADLPVEVLLKDNLRTTQRIHDLFKSHYEELGGVALGPLGEDVTWQAIEHEADLPAQLEQTVRQLIEAGVARSDIVVLTARGQSSTILRRLPKLGSLPFRQTGGRSVEEGVGWETVRRFKGLESAAVIVVEVDDLVKQEELRYVAFSRARSFLSVIALKGVLRSLKQRCRGVPLRSHS